MLLGDLHLPTIAVRSNGLRDAWAVAQHPVIGGKPRSQGIAPEARGAQLQVFVHAEWMHPQQTIDRLRAMAGAFEVLVLQADSGLIYGQFLIDALDIQPRWTLPDETIVSALVMISLGEAGVDVMLDASASEAVAGSGTDTTDDAPPESIGVPSDEPPFERWP